MSIGKGVKLGVQGANSDNFDLVFHPFTLFISASDVVQSSSFGSARRIGARVFWWGCPRLGCCARTPGIRAPESPAKRRAGLRHERIQLRGHPEPRAILPTLVLFSTPFLCSLAPRMWCKSSSFGSARRIGARVFWWRCPRLVFRAQDSATTRRAAQREGRIRHCDHP